MKLKTLFILGTSIIFFIACGKPGEQKISPKGHTTDELKLTGDKTVYGLACDGCTDSVILLLPNDGSDPVKYDIIDAFHNHKVIGHPKIGDWLGLVLNKSNKKVADMVIDLDELKATWCYVVMPKMRPRDGMGRNAQNRMMAHMPDSIKATLMVPREYGFTLKRQWTAKAVGRIRQQNTLENESPVVYPSLKNYFAWHILNGKLVLTYGKRKLDKDNNIYYVNQKNDTAEFIFMMKDSLQLKFRDKIISYYRKANENDVNKTAQKIAAQSAKRAIEEIK